MSRCGLLFLTAAITVSAATGDMVSSEEIARQALGILQSDATAADKAIACKRLAIYGGADAVPALASQLDNPELSSWARIALEAIPGPAADAALRNALGRLQGNLLVGVINSIGVRRDSQAVSDLAVKLKGTEPEVLSAAAVALGHIGGDQASRVLDQALLGGSSATRAAAAEGLILCAEWFLAQKQFSKAARMYDLVRNADVPPQRKLEGIRGAILARQTSGLPLLLETLRSTNRAEFGIGLRTARELSGRAVTDALAAEISSAPPARQGPLLLALADRQDEAVLPAILQAARNGQTPLQLVAIEIMTRLGHPDCLPVLLDLLVGNNGELVPAAKAALVGWTGEELNLQLRSRLTEASGNARRPLVELAGQRQVAATVPDLLKAAKDADPAVRAAGIKALGETASLADLDALTGLLAAAKTADETSAVQEALESACARIPDKAACADKLLALLPGSTAPAKSALLRVLGTVGTAKALEAVRAAQTATEPAVRDTAVRVLADWPEPPALPALLEIVRTTQDDSHRFLALRGCVRLLDLSEQPAPEKTKTYADLLGRSDRADDRKALLSGLANVPDPAALKLVEPLLADTQVAAEAELALLKIASAVAKTAPTEAKAAATRVEKQSKNPATRERAAKLLGDLEKNR